jgi:MFS family permease
VAGLLVTARAEQDLDTGLRSRLLGWLPPGRSSRCFLAVFFVDSVGTGLFLAGSALFFTRAVGLTSTQVGLGLSLSGVAGLLCSVPLGRLADRFGSRRTLVVLYLWRGLGFLAYLLVDDFPTFVMVACLLGAGEWAVGPVVQAAVGAEEESDSRVRTMAAVNAVRNAGFMIGALLATIAITSDSADAYRGLVLANGASFFLAAVLLARIRLVRSRIPDQRAIARIVRVRDQRYLLLAALNGVLFLHTVLLSVGLPLWIATRTEAPGALVGVVVALNTVVAISLGVRLSRGVEGVSAAAARQHRAGWCLAACCVLVASSAGVSGTAASVLLLAAAVALTLGEVWQSLGGWGLSYALSPDAERSYYLAAYYLGEPCATIVGPALLTMGVMRAGSVGWLSLACLFAVTGVAVRAIAMRAGRPAEAPRERRAPASRLRRGRSQGTPLPVTGNGT